MDTKKQFEEPLTIREKIAIKILFMILKIIKAGTSTYELDAGIKEVEADLKTKPV